MPSSANFFSKIPFGSMDLGFSFSDCLHISWMAFVLVFLVQFMLLFNQPNSFISQPWCFLSICSVLLEGGMYLFSSSLRSAWKVRHFSLASPGSKHVQSVSPNAFRIAVKSAFA